MNAEPLFTVEEASRRLPLVRRIVQDILDAYPGFERRARELQRVLGGTPSPAERGGVAGLRQETDAQAEQLNGLIRELQQLGCSFKGFEEGLVDFPSALEDRPILLCWKHGEDEIEWWHELEGGYAGRQPLTPDATRRIHQAVEARRAT